MEITINLPIFLEVGIIDYKNLETGFWKLTNAQNEFPLDNLPNDFQKEGIKVAAILKKIEKKADIFMVGDFYEVLSIKEIE